MLLQLKLISEVLIISCITLHCIAVLPPESIIGSVCSSYRTTSTYTFPYPSEPAGGSGPPSSASTFVSCTKDGKALNNLYRPENCVAILDSSL